MPTIVGDDGHDAMAAFLSISTMTPPLNEMRGSHVRPVALMLMIINIGRFRNVSLSSFHGVMQ